MQATYSQGPSIRDAAKRSLQVAVAIVAIMLNSGIAGPGTVAPNLPSGEFVARVYYDRVEDLVRLSTYDVHEYNNVTEHWVRVSATRDIYEKLQRQGWRVSVDTAATENLYPPLPESFLGGYRTVDELYADLATTVSNYPAITELVIYGQSYDRLVGGDSHGGHLLAGYDLKAMRVTNRRIPGPKPVFFLMADIHAREITTPEVAMRFLDWLVQGYGSDADATWLVDHHETWIVPTANPDGHWIVELGGAVPYYQRKNADRAGSTFWPPTITAQYGVDCNRNHSFKWNQGGASSDPLDQTYNGKSPASEPEVSSLQTLIQNLIPAQRGSGDTAVAPDSTAGILITLHSYGDEVLWPWGYTPTPAPNAAGLQAIGQKLASYNGYTAMQSYQLYPTSGTSDEWAYGELGIPAYTFELGEDFMPPYSQVDSVQWPGNRAAFIYACKIARAPYASVRGPDIRNLAAALAPDGITISALADGRNNGSRAIQAAQCAVDIPWWSTNATSIAMVASDGSFDSSLETVETTLPVALLTPGRHIVFVRACNTSGNWGPPSAIFADLGMMSPVLTASLAGGQTIVSWASLTNMAYTVQARTDLRQEWLDTAFSGIAGTGSTMTYTNTEATQTRFFRVKVVPRL